MIPSHTAKEPEGPSPRAYDVFYQMAGDCVDGYTVCRPGRTLRLGFAARASIGRLGEFGLTYRCNRRLDIVEKPSYKIACRKKRYDRVMEADQARRVRKGRKKVGHGGSAQPCHLGGGVVGRLGRLRCSLDRPPHPPATLAAILDMLLSRFATKSSQTNIIL